MEVGVGVDWVYMGIFIEFGILYVNYMVDKFMEYIRLFSARINIL